MFMLKNLIESIEPGEGIAGDVPSQGQITPLFDTLRESAVDELAGPSLRRASAAEVLALEDVTAELSGTVSCSITVERTQVRPLHPERAYQRLVRGLLTAIREGMGNDLASGEEVVLPLEAGAPPRTVVLRRKDPLCLQVLLTATEPLEIVLLDVDERSGNSLFRPSGGRLSNERPLLRLEYQARQTVGFSTAVVLAFAGETPPDEVLLESPVEDLLDRGLRHVWAYTLQAR